LLNAAFPEADAPLNPQALADLHHHGKPPILLRQHPRIEQNHAANTACGERRNHPDLEPENGYGRSHGKQKSPRIDGSTLESFGASNARKSLAIIAELRLFDHATQVEQIRTTSSNLVRSTTKIHHLIGGAFLSCR
jgi:hypothetical protein